MTPRVWRRAAGRVAVFAGLSVAVRSASGIPLEVTGREVLDFGLHVVRWVLDGVVLVGLVAVVAVVAFAGEEWSC